MNSKLKQLLEAVNEEYKKADRAYKINKKSAQEIAESAVSSMSQAGDRFHSQGSADLAKQRFETINLLKQEIEEKGEKIGFNFEGHEIFLVDNPILIKGFKLVSTQSPVGQKLLNKI